MSPLVEVANALNADGTVPLSSARSMSERVAWLSAPGLALRHVVVDQLLAELGRRHGRVTGKSREPAGVVPADARFGLLRRDHVVGVGLQTMAVSSVDIRQASKPTMSKAQPPFLRAVPISSSVMLSFVKFWS